MRGYLPAVVAAASAAIVTFPFLAGSAGAVTLPIGPQPTPRAAVPTVRIVTPTPPPVLASVSQPVVTQAAQVVTAVPAPPVTSNVNPPSVSSAVSSANQQVSSAATTVTDPVSGATNPLPAVSQQVSSVSQPAASTANKQVAPLTNQVSVPAVSLPRTNALPVATPAVAGVVSRLQSGGSSGSQSAATPTPASQTSDPPTPSSAATASATDVVTATPSATATATDTTTISGTPLCDGQNGRPAHDPTKWHPLVAYNADGSVLCTYGHEHGMDPTELDAVFGPLPLDQQISYPWATVSSSGVPENGPDIKHRVYKWLVQPQTTCNGATAPDGTHKEVTAFREELHADGSLGAAVRFHSFWGQYQLTDCDTGQVGTMYVGGHMDYAYLRAGDTRVQSSNDPPSGCTTNGDFRQEGATDGQEAARSVWYGSNVRAPGCDDAYGDGPFVGVQVNVGTDPWGPVDPNDPTALHFYPDHATHDETIVSTDALTIWISQFPTDDNGLVNFTGHVDRHGIVVPEQAGQAEGQDYIPVLIENAKPGPYAGPPDGPFGYDGDVPGPQGQAGFYVMQPSEPQ